MIEFKRKSRITTRIMRERRRVWHYFSLSHILLVSAIFAGLLLINQRKMSYDEARMLVEVNYGLQQEMLSRAISDSRWEEE